MRVRKTIASAIVAVLALPGAAHAQNADVTARLRRGIELRRTGHDDEAAVEFRAAYEATHSPVSAAQLGFAEQALGQWIAADSHVREAMTATDDPWVRRNRAVLEGAMTSIGQHIGELDVRGSPLGAEMTINGVRIGTLPSSSPIRLVAGVVHVEVRAPGYVSLLRDVPIVASELAREDIVLPRSPPIGVAQESHNARIITDHVPGPVFLPSIAAASALLAIGIGGSIAHEITTGAYNGMSSCRGIGDPTPPSGCETNVWLATSTAEEALTIGGFVLGGLSSALAIGLAISRPVTVEHPRSSVGMQCSGIPSALGVVCRGQF